jgi:hypothetical protein
MVRQIDEPPRTKRPRAKRVDIHLHLPAAPRRVRDAAAKPGENRSVAPARCDDAAYEGTLLSRQRFNSLQAYERYLDEFYSRSR